MKTVMCFGTFDLLHLGHLYYFEQARRYGDYLIVVIARDKTKQKQKKKILFSEQERQQLVQSLKQVDEAVLGYPDNHLKIIQERKPDVICLGYDHPIQKKELQKKLSALGLHPSVVRIPHYYTQKYKTTRLREKILEITHFSLYLKLLEL